MDDLRPMIHAVHRESNIIDNRSMIIEKIHILLLANSEFTWLFNPIVYIVAEPMLLPSSTTESTKPPAMTHAQPLSRASLSQQIRDRLLSRIMTGALKPGDRLIELKIAAEMATSQAPVREALRELEAMGVIETLRNKGARVRVITDEELRQIYDVRAQLEGYASELVTRSGIALKSKLTACIRDMKRAARKSDSLAFADHNMEFHRIIVEGSGNMVLLELWETLNVKMRTMVNVSRSSKNLLDLAQSHQAIVDAIAAGDADQSHAAARMHVLDNKPDATAKTA